jgi:hypothetical protein
MKLGDNFSDSFEYTKKLFSDVVVIRLIILIVLSIIPIVNWIVLGYAARVLKESPGAGTPPKLENYGQLFAEGAKVFFAYVIYLLVPWILIAIGTLGTFAGLVQLPGQQGTPLPVVAGMGAAILLVGTVLAILLLIFLDAGLAHMIKTGKFGKAFAFSEILGIIRGIGWVKYLGWVVITAIIRFMLVIIGVSTITAVPLVGALVIALLVLPLSVFIFRSLGLLYNEGAPAGLKVQAPVVTGLACASCGTPLQPQQKFCPNCGAAAPTPPSVTQSGTKFCISCGAKIPSTVSFCGSCGAKQT